MVDTYKQKLKEIIDEGLLNDQTNPKWNELNDLITEEVLDAAYEASKEFRFPFVEVLGRKPSYPTTELVPRERKTMERIEVKKAMVGRPDLGFKTNCDLMAFRVPVERVEHIWMFGTILLNHATKQGNPLDIRRPNVYSKDGKMLDIVQFMYIYHRNEGFLAEYQICHPFAALKFKHDSGVRDGKPGFVDFKKAKIHVYREVKERLLKGPLELDEFVKIWVEGFGEEPSDEWKDCFPSIIRDVSVEDGFIDESQ
jgi:hypothetical protein